MGNRKRGKTSVYKNFIISYIVTLLAPMLIMSVIVLYHYVNVLKEEVEVNLSNSFRKSIDHFQNQFDQLNNITIQIELSNLVNSLDIRDKPFVANNVKKEINKYLTNTYIDEIFIYNYKEKYIASSNYICSLDDFINFIISDYEDKMFLEKFKDSPSTTALYYFPQRVWNLSEESHFMYLNKIPVNNSNQYGIVMYMIPESALERLISPALVTKDTYLCILDRETNQTLFALSEENNDEKVGLVQGIFSSIDEPLDLKELKIGERQYSVFSDYSEKYKLKFIQLMPDNLLTGKIDKIRMVYFVSMIVIIILSGFIIAILMRINYRPIKNLKILIEESTLSSKSSYKDKLNEIEMLEYAFSQYNKENEELKELANSNQDVVQKYLIDCFLMGQANQIEHILDTCKLSGLDFNKKYYCTILLKSGSLNCEDRINNIRDIMDQYAVQKEIQHYIIKDMTLNNLVIIFGSDTGFDLVPKEVAIKIMKFMKEKHGENIRIGIGSFVEDIFDIYKSYQESLEVLDYNHILSKTNIISIADLSKREEENIKYPFKIFDQLVSSIHKKDILSIKDTINQLLLYMKSENLSLYWAKNICYDIVNTIFKEMLMISEHTALLNKPYIEKIYGTEMNTFENIEQIIAEIIDDITSFLTVGEGTYELKLLQQIIKYIRENYTNPNFSIQKLADSIQMSTPYLSQYFKKNTDYTLSEYVTKLRMEKAKELIIKSEMSIYEIASEVGYYSVSSFIRKFKEKEDMTPGQYKKKYS